MSLTGGGFHTDVLVIGGGPAGLAIALAVRRHGFKVLVADCAFPPIDKACGEGLLPDALPALRTLGVSLDDLETARFRGIRFVGDHDSVSAEFPQGSAVGIRRLLLHQRLVSAANTAGVDLLWGARVSFSGAQVCLNGLPVCSRWVIGADGQNSRIGAWADLSAGDKCHRRFGWRRHFRIAPWSDFTEIHWADGYQVYVTPIGREELCVAVLSQQRIADFDAAVGASPALRRHLSSGFPTTPIKGAVTMSRRLSQVARGRVALIGDASGSADAITGEGISLCFRQAIALSDAMVADDLSAYEVAHRKIMKQPLLMSSLMLWMDENPWLRRRALRALAGEPQLFARLLAVHVGDLPMHAFGLGPFMNLGWQLLTA